MSSSTSSSSSSSLFSYSLRCSRRSWFVVCAALGVAGGAACTGAGAPAESAENDVQSKDPDSKPQPRPTAVGDVLSLPDGYFPESLHAGKDGTIYVGSLSTGQIVKFAPGKPEPEVLLPKAEGRNIAGVLVDEDDGSILACTGSVVSFGNGNVVRRYSLSDGAELAHHPLPDNVFCNDMAFDGKNHDLFITDSVGGRVFKLTHDAKDGTSPTVWMSDPLLRGPAPGDLGADGIAYDGDGNGSFFINNVTTGGLVHVPIERNGEAGKAVEIKVTPALEGPDGMRVLSKNVLIVVEGPANRLSTITVDRATATGKRTTISDKVLEPASVVRVGDDAWVAEGQILRMFTNPPTPPEPFVIRRIPLAEGR